MKLFIKTLFTFLFLFVLGACDTGSNNESMSYAVLKQLSEVSNKDISKYRAVFFVPSSGCGGCISGAESYLLDDYLQQEKTGVLFVLTGFDSEKIVRVRLGANALRHTDVFLDNMRLFDKPPFILQYPKVIMLDNGKIVDEREISPNDGVSVYDDLNKYIAEI